MSLCFGLILGPILVEFNNFFLMHRNSTKIALSKCLFATVFTVHRVATQNSHIFVHHSSNKRRTLNERLEKPATKREKKVGCKIFFTFWFSEVLTFDELLGLGHFYRTHKELLAHYQTLITQWKVWKNSQLIDTKWQKEWQKWLCIFSILLER